jgi:hypothetical protein
MVAGSMVFVLFFPALLEVWLGMQELPLMRQTGSLL